MKVGHPRLSYNLPPQGTLNMSVTKPPDSAIGPPDRRKLVAVVHADMVGYSRLIGLDDAETLSRLRTLRRDLIDPAIEEYGGRIVQTRATRCSSFSTASTERCAVP